MQPCAKTSLLFLVIGAACTGSIEGPDPGSPAGGTGSSPSGAGPSGSPGASGNAGTPGTANPGGTPGAGMIPGTGTLPGAPGAPSAPRGVADFACNGAPTTPPAPRRLWRLTPTQYANTVALLISGKRSAGTTAPTPPADLTVPLEPAADDYRFETYSGTHGLTNFEFGRAVTTAAEVAAKVVTAVKTGTCWATATAGAAADTCVETLIKDKGAILFRRPLAADEVTRFGGIVKTNTAMFGRDEALATALRAMLMSPHFMFLTEVGEPIAGTTGQAKLTQYEIAAAISHTLTQGPADEPLWTAATMGALSTPEQISAHVVRILDSPAATKAAREFVAQYFDLGKVLTVAKSIEKAGEYGRERIMQDADLLITSVFNTNKRKDFLKTLLTTTSGFAGADSYKVYGLSADPKSNSAIQLPAGQRAGLLTHPAFLAGHASFEETLPVKRGEFVNESILCREIPAVPIDVVAKLPTANQTMREKLAVHSKEPRCAACHNLLDPPGLALEQYDAYGRYRTNQFNKVIDPAGMLTGTVDADGMFKNAVEMSQKLASSITVEQCFIRHTFRYLMGRPEDAYDSCSLDAAAKAYAAGGGDFNGMVAAMFTSASFLNRSF